MTIKYLFVVDDEGARRETYNSIAKSSDGRLEIELHWTPKEAAEGFSLADREYVGAILDFHLQAQAGQDSAALNDGTPVTTGLGMMAWLRERAPELPLYAITDLGRDHAPLFYTAASDWFNATPLFHVDLSNPTLTRPEREVIATEFVSPATRQLSHKVDMVLDARVHFEGLFACQNSSKTDAKLTYDWLCAFARAGKNPDRLRRELNAMPYGYRIGKIDPKTLAQYMAHWQLHLGRMLRALGRTTDDWQPVTLPFDDEDRLAKDFVGLKTWHDDGPVHRYINRLTTQEFFTAQDVRAAMITAARS